MQAYIFFKLLHLIQFLYAVSTQPKTSLAQYFIRYPSKSILFLHFTHIPFILSSQFATSIQYPSSLISYPSIHCSHAVPSSLVFLQAKYIFIFSFSRKSFSKHFCFFTSKQ